ncbi:MAG: helix-turn-helix domain-containing protein [Blautia faecis]
MSKVEIKDRIKEAIEIREITQSELAEKAKIDKGQLSSYISGKYKPRQNNIDALSLALNVKRSMVNGF